MTFYKLPFLVITSFFILGVILSDLIEGHLILHLSFVFAIIAALISHSITKRMWFIISAGLAILLFGFIRTEASENKDQLLAGEEKTVLIKILEADRSDANWKKSIGEVIAVKENQSLIPIKSKVLLFFNSSVTVGDQLVANIQFDPIKNKGNPGEFDAESYWSSKDVHLLSFINSDSYVLVDNIPQGAFSELIAGIRENIIEFIHDKFDKNTAGILDAILIGDKTALSNETRNSFANAGAMHVLAVSGLHVGIIMYLLMFVLGRFPRFINKKGALIVTIVFAWGYAILTGMSPSVLRATLMFSLLLGGQVLGRKSNSINTLFFSAFIILIIDPSLLKDLGFQLSYLAVLGILLLQKPIARLVYIPNRYVRMLWEGTAVGIAAQVFTVPLTLFHFHQFPNYFALTNIGVMLFAGVILGVGLIMLTLKGIEFIAGLIAVVLGFITNSFLFFIQYVESLPASVASGFEISLITLLILYALILILVLSKNRFVTISSISLLLVSLILVQFDRYDRMNDEHLVIFNSNRPLILVKNGKKATCFYSDDLSKHKRYLDDYRKVYPSKIDYLRLSENSSYKVEKEDSRIFISRTEDYCRIDLPHHSVMLRTRNTPIKIKVDKTICLPYVKELKDELNLKDGSYIFNF